MQWKKINFNKLNESTQHNSSSNLDLFIEFVENNDIVSSRSGSWLGTTVRRFLENGGIADGNTYIHLRKEITNIDHEYMYKNRKGEILITSHSYMPEDEIIEKFNEWNDGDFKLTLYGAEKSWYYPNETTLFVITLKDVEVK